MGNGLGRIIEDKKDAIVRQWFDAFRLTYAPDTAEFLKSRQDPFANPVGSTALKGLAALLDQLLADMDPDCINAALDPIIRVRAVQNFSPSDAVAFILALKKILRNSVDPSLQSGPAAGAFTALENKIDQLCLMAFDIFMQCREAIYRIRATETRNRTFRAFERAGLVAELPDLPAPEPDA